MEAFSGLIFGVTAGIIIGFMLGRIEALGRIFEPIAAKRLGISNGVGDNKFAPEQAISWQEMFTPLYNTLKIIDQLPEGDTGKTLSDFTDSGSVSPYAQEAMAYLVKTGAVGGNNGMLLPSDTTTRAQMAQVIYNLLAK